MKHQTRTMAAALGVAMTLAGGALGAQAPAVDPTTRLRTVLPAEVADRVLATIAGARERDLPAEALEQRALKFAARGVAPADIARSVVEQAERLERAQATLLAARGGRPAGDEVEAGAEAMRRGVDGAGVRELARSAPSGRSLAVPLYVVGSLMDRGLPSDEALRRVRDRLQARASDAELETLPARLPASAVANRGGRPAQTGRDLSVTRRPGSAGGAAQGAGVGGPPAGVPAGGPAGRTPPVGGGPPAAPPGRGGPPAP